MSAPKLPPLPEAARIEVRWLDPETRQPTPLFTAEQMWAYALEVIETVRSAANGRDHPR